MSESTFEELKRLSNAGKLKECESVLDRAKMELSMMDSLPPNVTVTASSKSERMRARETYEIAVMLSVQAGDMDGLERHLLLLRPFYFDYQTELGDSPKRNEILGLELLALLVQSRLAEFHSLIELLITEEMEDRYVAFVVSIEQYLMEGSYNKVLDARQHTPSTIYSWLLENLEDTVRDEIAGCLEVAYRNISMKAALKLMNFPSQAKLEEYVSSKDNWIVNDGIISFKGEPVKDFSESIPSHSLINESLAYAHELERIV